MKPVERVKKLIEHYHDGVVSRFEKRIGLSNNSIQTAIKKNANLKDVTLNAILDNYPDVNPLWLLRGQEEMLLSLSYPRILNSDRSEYQTEPKSKDKKLTAQEVFRIIDALFFYEDQLLQHKYYKVWIDNVKKKERNAVLKEFIENGVVLGNDSEK